MNIYKYIDITNELINDTSQMLEFKVYHLNSNISIFTINDEIMFALKGVSFKQKDILDEDYFKELYKVYTLENSYMN